MSVSFRAIDGCSIVSVYHMVRDEADVGTGLGVEQVNEYCEALLPS